MPDLALVQAEFEREQLSEVVQKKNCYRVCSIAWEFRAVDQPKVSPWPESRVFSCCAGSKAFG